MGAVLRLPVSQRLQRSRCMRIVLDQFQNVILDHRFAGRGAPLIGGTSQHRAGGCGRDGGDWCRRQAHGPSGCIALWPRVQQSRRGLSRDKVCGLRSLRGQPHGARGLRSRRGVGRCSRRLRARLFRDNAPDRRQDLIHTQFWRLAGTGHRCYLIKNGSVQILPLRGPQMVAALPLTRPNSNPVISNT